MFVARLSVCSLTLAAIFGCLLPDLNLSSVDGCEFLLEKFLVHVRVEAMSEDRLVPEDGVRLEGVRAVQGKKIDHGRVGGHKHVYLRGAGI